MTPRADAFVFFGATGDLARKMIFPALYRLVKTRRLDVPVIGVAFSGWDAAQLAKRATESVAAHGGLDDREALAKLLSLVRYVDGDYKNAKTFDALRVALGDAKRPVHYLAIPPKLFATVVAGLGEHGCARDGRVVVEKPFGHDLASARELNRILRTVFPEDAIYRIDHFLGETAVLNILYLRLANSLLDTLFDRRHVTRVQITMAEDFGVEERGSFYDATGCLLDVVENHVFQIVSLLAMDAPALHAPDALRQAQAHLFQSIRPLAKADVVRGQYRGYREIHGVHPDSDVETFVALRLFVDSPRWAGVPFVIRAGKRLPVTATEAVVEFADPPLDAFPQVPVAPGPTYLRFRLSPDVATAVALRVLAQGPTPSARVEELLLTRTEPDSQTPYERLLGGAIESTSGLFVRQDTVEACWRIVAGVLTEHAPALPYESGTWGPSQAGAIVEPGRWLDPTMRLANAKEQTPRSRRQ
jgi:glucose-6-phosphate 1-dehydrogenase